MMAPASWNVPRHYERAPATLCDSCHVRKINRPPGSGLLRLERFFFPRPGSIGRTAARRRDAHGIFCDPYLAVPTIAERHGAQVGEVDAFVHLAVGVEGGHGVEAEEMQRDEASRAATTVGREDEQ